MNNKLRSIIYCSLNSCTNSSDEVTVFKCPKNEGRKRKWQFFMNANGNDNVELFKQLTLCEYHFEPEDILKYGRGMRLRAGAVPKFKNIQVKSIFTLQL